MGKEKICPGKDEANISIAWGTLPIFALTLFRTIKVLYTRKLGEQKKRPISLAEKSKFNVWKTYQKKQHNKFFFAHAKKTLQNLQPFFYMLDFHFSATDICVLSTWRRRKRGGFLASTIQSTPYTYVYLRRRVIGLSRQVNNRARKNVICQVFFSLGRRKTLHPKRETDPKV